MYPFSYKVAFHVSHPGIDPEIVSRELGLQPTSMCKAGDRKRTPSGSLLAGYNEKSHWYHNFPAADGALLSEFLEHVAEKLYGHREFLVRLCAEGGSLELSIGWFSGVNSGDQFNWQLLRKLAGLQISLSLDIYADVPD